MAAVVSLLATGAGLGFGLAAHASGPPVTSPAATVGSYYSGPVHQCWSNTDESRGYLEEHTTARGNCDRGFTQLTVNELTPVFTLQLPGGPVLVCTASTAAQETALTCSAPTPTPAPSTPAPSPSSSSGSPAPS